MNKEDLILINDPQDIKVGESYWYEEEIGTDQPYFTKIENVVITNIDGDGHAWTKADRSHNLDPYWRVGDELCLGVPNKYGAVFYKLKEK